MRKDQHKWAYLQTDSAVPPPTEEKTASHSGMQAAATASAMAAKKERKRMTGRSVRELRGGGNLPHRCHLSHHTRYVRSSGPPPAASAIPMQATSQAPSDPVSTRAP